MKYIGALLALASLGLMNPALANSSWAGISGHVIDLRSGHPIADARVLLYRSTSVTNDRYQVMYLRTNGNGFYSKMPLEPGRYVVMVRVPGRTDGCAVDDLIGGEVARVNVRVGYDRLTCSGPRIHPGMVNPNGGGDLYII